MSLINWKKIDRRNFTILFRFAKHRTNEDDSWIDQIRKESLCEVLRRQHHLITIFELTNSRHHGNLEEAILESLFNGDDSSSTIEVFSEQFSHLFSNEI